MRVTTLWVILAVALAAVAIACGSDPTATPRPTPTATPAPTATPLPPGVTPDPTATPRPTPTPDASFEAEWARLVADAQAEGEIVLSLGGTDSRHIRDTLSEFSKKFDIKVVASTGSGSANTTRILAERSRGRYTVDFNFGGTSSTLRLVSADALAEVVPLIIDPTILNRTPDHWHLSPKIWWSDTANLYSMASELQVDNLEDVWYNTDKLTAEEAAAITSYADLADPKWSGKLTMAGYATTGSGVTTRVRIHFALGQEWWEAVTRNAADGGNLLDFSDYSGCAELLARGAVSIALGCDREIRPLAVAGLPVAAITDSRVMDEGLSAEVRGTGSVLKNAPHPRAAQLFLNWWYSQDGMETDVNFTRNLAPNPKLRSDVGQGKVPDSLWERVPQLQGLLDANAITIIDQGSQAFEEARADSLAYLQAVYDSLGVIYTP
ncbi:MAG: extracellular solute-binding protein [Chloroflexi bacterium]|nr:extracellular solute-binding protein [Chloroflexota bacterium]